MISIARGRPSTALLPATPGIASSKATSALATGQRIPGEKAGVTAPLAVGRLVMTASEIAQNP